MEFFPPKILDKILLRNDEEFKKLLAAGWRFVGNFYRGDLFGDLQVDDTKKALEIAGYVVRLANAYNIVGKYMPHSNSLWVRGKRIKLKPTQKTLGLMKLLDIEGKLFNLLPKEVKHIILRVDTVKDKGLKKGIKVKYFLRTGRVKDITWDGQVHIVFKDCRKPKQLIVWPFLVEKAL